MRVLVDVRHLGSPTQSGVGEYTIQLLKALFRIRGHEYLLFSSGSQTPPLPQFFPEIQDLPNVRHIHISIQNKMLNASFLLANRPSVRDLVGVEADLLFAPNLAIFPLPLSIPTILTVHDATWSLFPDLYSWKMRLWHKAVRPVRLLTQAKTIICPSQSTASDMKNTFGIPTNRLMVIPHGINHERFTSETPSQKNLDISVRIKYRLPERFLLFLGTLEPRKNIRMLLEAVLAYRKQSGDDIRLVLAGASGWRNADVRNMLLMPEISPWVSHIQYVPSSDRPALYRSATAFVWPTLYEGFGLPVLEAMACGTPVITSAISSIPEVTGSAALLVNPYLSSDLTEAIRQILTSEALRKRLHDEGLKRASIFSWVTAAEKTLETFERTLHPETK